MNPGLIADTGIIVAFLDRREEHHAWVKEQFVVHPPPLITCEAVLSETWFLLADVPGGRENLISFLQRKVIMVPFALRDELLVVAKILTQYPNFISVADACLVRMSELYSNSVIFTLDSDFRIYRKNKRQLIPVLMP